MEHCDATLFFSLLMLYNVTVWDILSAKTMEKQNNYGTLEELNDW